MIMCIVHNKYYRMVKTENLSSIYYQRIRDHTQLVIEAFLPLQKAITGPKINLKENIHIIVKLIRSLFSSKSQTNETIQKNNRTYDFFAWSLLIVHYCKLISYFHHAWVQYTKVITRCCNKLAIANSVIFTLGLTSYYGINSVRLFWSGLYYAMGIT